MVQRYAYDQVLGIIPDVEGGIVFYEDYAELARKLRELAKQVVNSPCDWKTDELAREILDL